MNNWNWETSPLLQLRAAKIAMPYLFNTPYYQRANGNTSTAIVPYSSTTGRRIAKVKARTTRIRNNRILARTMPGSGFTRTAGYYGRFGGLSGEKKFHDVELPITTAAATGTIMSASMNIIAAGTSEIQRIGRISVIRQIHINGQFTLSNTTAQTNTWERFRFILYVDHQCNGATAAVLDILETADVLSFRNLAQSKRFTILWDHTAFIHLQCGAGNTTTNQFGKHVKLLKYNKADLNIPIEFNGPTGAITEVRSNNIGVLCLTHDGRGEVEFLGRLRFTDS